MVVSVKPYYIKTSPLICFANQLAGFYMIQVFNKSYFRIEIIGKPIYLKYFYKKNIDFNEDLYKDRNLAGIRKAA